MTLIKETVTIWWEWEWIQERKEGEGLDVVSLDATFKEFLNEWEQRNLTVGGGCGLKGRIFLKYEKCNSVFYASNNNNIKELGKVMILERKGSISQVI